MVCAPLLSAPLRNAAMRETQLRCRESSISALSPPSFFLSTLTHTRACSRARGCTHQTITSTLPNSLHCHFFVSACRHQQACCKWNLSISLRSFTGTSPPHLPAVCPARRSFVQYCTFIEHFPLRAGIASFQVLEVFRLGYIQAPWYRAIITLQWQHHILNIHHLTTSPRKTVCTQRRTTPTQAHEPNQH